MRFTQFYLPPQEYISDNQRMRIRLGSFISSHRSLDQGTYLLVQTIKQKIGLDINQTGLSFDFEYFFKTVAINDLLDTISTIHDFFAPHQREPWRTFVNTVFSEEGLSYAVNEKGEVRFKPDEEFERNRISTLKGLSGDEFKAATTAFNNAFSALQKDINKSKYAIRDIFEANEIVYKKITKELNHTRLTSKNIDAAKPLLMQAINHSDETAKTVFEGQIDAFKKWVDSMHPYRHGQDVESYDTPPIDLTILALSTGASYLRWLASVAQSIGKQTINEAAKK